MKEPAGQDKARALSIGSPCCCSSVFLGSQVSGVGGSRVSRWERKERERRSREEGLFEEAGISDDEQCKCYRRLGSRCSTGFYYLLIVRGDLWPCCGRFQFRRGAVADRSARNIREINVVMHGGAGFAARALEAGTCLATGCARANRNCAEEFINFSLSPYVDGSGSYDRLDNAERNHSLRNRAAAFGINLEFNGLLRAQ